jgi:tripartite-type tricarboxylate transporter receptor subunit TctC
MRVRKACVIAMMLTALAGVTAPVQAQAPAWPTKPIRLVVPFAAGGSVSILGRLLSDKLSISLGQPVVPEDRAGAGGIIGSDIVAKAAPDGYTLLLGIAATHAIQAALPKPLPYDILRDFAPIGIVGAGAMAMSVSVALPVSNLNEFISYARANPDKVNYGTGGIATSGHLLGEGLKSMTGIAMTHVPYKGSAPAFTDLYGGQLHAVMTDIVTTGNFFKGGKLRVIAVAGPKRSPAFPDVPTMTEQGVPFEPGSWNALFAPAKTPAPIITRLNAELNKIVLNDKDMQAYMSSGGLVAMPGDPDVLRKTQQKDIEVWTRIVKAANIKVE